MLIICDSINKKELEPYEDNFPLDQIKLATQKAKNGLGKIIQGSPLKESRLIKVYLTSKKGAGRIIFLVVIKKEHYIPVVLRLKKDKIIGENITIKNKKFEELLNRNLDLALDDIKNKKYQTYDIA